MMRKKRLFISLCICIVSCLIGSVSGALAWFRDQAVVPAQDGLVESSQGAYFARGQGTQSSPYIINKPIHLYNLAWLQYIGYFNDDDAPYYFALDDEDASTNLDMSGWVLPPIGTRLYPFIGNFEGNGETISNLTVDNVIASGHIEKTPTLITNSAKDENGVLRIYQKAGDTPASFLSSTVDIVGFFGVLGDISGMATVSADYSAANSVNAVALDGLKVQSASTYTVVGIACGYDNATLNGVAVNNSELHVAERSAPLTSLSANLSDYALVGCATESALQKCFLRKDTTSLPKINNPNTVNGGQNWGGSIDMLRLYTQLAEIRDTSSPTSYIGATTPFSHITGQTFVDGVEDLSRRTTSPDNRSVRLNYSYYYYRYEGNKLYWNDPDHGNPAYASFTFARGFTSNDYSTYNDDENVGRGNNKYNCLYGKNTFSAGSTYTINNRATRDYFRISKNGHYLYGTRSINHGRYTYSVSDTTNPDNGLSFYLDAVNRLVTTVSSTTVYLYNNSGTLGLTTNAGTDSNYYWNWDEESGNFTTASGSYVLNYDSSWKLDAFVSPYYTIQLTSLGESGYLRRSGSYNLTTGTKANALKFGYGPVKTSQHSTPANGYYEQSTGANGSGNYNVLGDDGGSYHFQIYTDSQEFYLLSTGEVTGTGYLTTGSRYVTYGSQFSTSTSSTGAAEFKISYNSEGESKNVSQVKTGATIEIATGSTTATSSYTTNDTYFPLLMEPNTYKPMDQYIDPDDPGGQKKYNTGYIVSGCNDETSNDYQKKWGDIRVSAYSFSSLTDTSRVYTRENYLSGSSVVNPGWTTITSDAQAANLKLQKYTSSKSKLDDMLDESEDLGYVHGLHFMPADISISHLATIGKAVVLDGKTPQELNDKGVLEDRSSVYYGYQVPEDSIDFNLKSYGYVNFYAGTYFTNNDSFFSLHQIVRNDDNTIADIRHISEIYCPNYTDTGGNWLLADDDHPYIYKFKIGNTTKWSSYSKVDGQWVCTAVNDEPSHGPLLFDTQWIESPSSSSHTIQNGSLYYFEIPVNAGEYALGSVSGGTGAYLLYLDIGAGAANYKDVEQDETTVIEITELVFPVGVDFVDLSKYSGTFASLATGGNSATVTVKKTTTAIATHFAYTTNSDTGKSSLALTKAGNDPPNMPSSAFDVTFENEPVSVTYQASDLLFGPSSTYSITAERKIIQNYNPNVGTGTLSFTYVEKYTITNGVNGRRISLPVVAGVTPTWSVISGPANVSGGLVTFTGAGTAEIQSTWRTSSEIGEASNWTPLSSNNEGGVETDPIVRFHFLDHTSNSATPANVVVTYSYTGTENSTTHEQTFVYNIKVENRSGQSVVLVIDALKLSFASETLATYRVTITYGGNTYNVVAAGSEFTIPAL